MMLEEHFIWALVSFRLAEYNSKAISSVLPVPPLLSLFIPMVSVKIKPRVEANGIGRHSREDMYQMLKDDLKTVSTVLGDKPFVGGDAPCEDDCAVFGFVAQAAWAMPDSEYDKLVKGI